MVPDHSIVLMRIAPTGDTSAKFGMYKSGTKCTMQAFMSLSAYGQKHGRGEEARRRRRGGGEEGWRMGRTDLTSDLGLHFPFPYSDQSECLPGRNFIGILSAFFARMRLKMSPTAA